MAEDPAGLLQSSGPGARRYAEVGLSAPLGDFRILAKFDLVILTPDGSARILDWKTARKRPRRPWLADRWQTRVYPYLLARAGADLNQGRPILPDRIEMVYWFADFPAQPERFVYTAAAFEKDQSELSDLTATIHRLAADQFPLTDNEKRCVYCEYRSLCERGIRAGAIDEQSLDEVEIGLVDLDLEQIAEIEF